MWLADDFYFVAHDDSTGRPRLHPRAVQLGLAAALLGELMLVSRITVHNGRILISSHQPPNDALAHTILDRLIAQGPNPDLHAELAVIGRSAPEAVAQRLERGGQLAYAESRRLMRTTGRWLPTDANQAAWPAARTARLLSSNDEMTWHDVLLAALLAATGLIGQVLWDNDQYARIRLKNILAQLPDSVAELMTHTEAAIGNAVLAHRR